MNIRIYISVFFTLNLMAVSFKTPPICEVRTPESHYSKKKHGMCYVGNQLRPSTCGAISWFHDDTYLATVNFEAGCISTYKVNPRATSCTLLQIIRGKRGLEHISFHPQGNLAAVTINTTGELCLYGVDTRTHRLTPEPITTVKLKDPRAHGVRFTNQKDYLICTTIHGLNRIFVYRVNPTQENVGLDLISELACTYTSSKPKAIALTKDDRYIAIAFASNISKEKNSPYGLLAIHRFDSTTGAIEPNPICIYDNQSELQGPEDLLFSQDNSSLFVSDQSLHKIVVYRFDKERGLIQEKVGELKNPEGKLSFPHGIGLSPNGKYLGVSNYGTDQFSIYTFDPAN